MKDWWNLVKKAVAAWSDDYAPSMGAALSYYSVFSMAPLLLLVISIAGLIFGQDAARGQLFGTKHPPRQSSLPRVKRRPS